MSFHKPCFEQQAKFKDLTNLSFELQEIIDNYDTLDNHYRVAMLLVLAAALHEEIDVIGRKPTQYTFQKHMKTLFSLLPKDKTAETLEALDLEDSWINKPLAHDQQ
jgi:hypothetical protein